MNNSRVRGEGWAYQRYSTEVNGSAFSPQFWSLRSIKLNPTAVATPSTAPSTTDTPALFLKWENSRLQ